MIAGARGRASFGRRWNTEATWELSCFSTVSHGRRKSQPSVCTGVTRAESKGGAAKTFSASRSGLLCACRGWDSHILLAPLPSLLTAATAARLSNEDDGDDSELHRADDP